MYENQEKQKRYKMARLHEKVINARERGLPGKLAELGALCVAVGAGIWATQQGRMIVGSAVVMFILYSIILQILCRLVFLSISLITLPSYKRYIRQFNRWNQNWYSEDFSRRGKSHKHDKQGPQYDRVSNNNSDMTEDKARALFGLDETFSMETLKKARNAALKKCHPDQNLNGNQSDDSEELTKKVNLAYTILKGKADTRMEFAK